VEPLAFVEVLGRHDEVLARHPVYHWPARAGRAYDAQVLLDDPFVAPQHLSIEPAADGRYRVTDLQSVNGFSLRPSAQRVAQAEVGADDVIRMGRTQIRIRPQTYMVPPERRLRGIAVYRRPSAFVAAALVFLGMTLWGAWIGTTSRDEWASVLVPVLATALVVGVWVSVWSLVSRTVGGSASFAAHGFVACAALAAMGLAETLFDYLSFGFDARWLARAGTLCGAAVLAYMLYRHLRLSSRASRRSLGAIAAAIVALGFGVAAALERATETQRQGLQTYDETLKAPVFLWVAGGAPERFLAESAKLRREADDAARAND